MWIVVMLQFYRFCDIFGNKSFGNLKKFKRIVGKFKKGAINFYISENLKEEKKLKTIFFGRKSLAM